MGDRVVGVADALGIAGPVVVLGLGQELHAPVPKPPPLFNVGVGLGVVTEGGGGGGVGDCADCFHNFAHEFCCSVRVDDVGASAAEMNFVDERWCQCKCFPVGEGDNGYPPCIAVDDCKGFALARSGEALPLEIHGIAGAGSCCGVCVVHAVC